MQITQGNTGIGLGLLSTLLGTGLGLFAEKNLNDTKNPNSTFTVDIRQGRTKRHQKRARSPSLRTLLFSKIK